MATAIFYAESLGDSSTSSTTPQVKLTNSVSVVSGRKYLILGSATARIGSGLNARNAVVQIWDNTGSAEIALVNSSFADASSDPAVSLGAVYTAGSTGTVDFQLRYYRGGASNTIVVGSARLLVIELGDNDESTSPSDYARSSTSYGDAATLTEIRNLRSRVNNDPTLAKSFGPLVGTRLVKQCLMVKRAFSTRAGCETLRRTLEIGFPASVVTQLGL